jgi:SAM-dependent methyltransferase
VSGTAGGIGQGPEAAAYDDFALCYARWWGPPGAARFLPMLERLLLDGLAPGARVLDLCCGSGDLAACLLDRGFEVTGVDGSARLLEIARGRAPGAALVQADARSFSVDGRYDAAYSAFDSLNHMANWEDLLGAFQRVYAALRPQTAFVCDLNTDRAYLEQWDDAFGHAADDVACVVAVRYDRRERAGRFDAAVFEKEPDARWRRRDVRLVQHPYEPPEVARALERAGFADVQVVDAAALPGLQDSVGRVVYLARRLA